MEKLSSLLCLKAGDKDANFITH